MFLLSTLRAKLKNKPIGGGLRRFSSAAAPAVPNIEQAVVFFWSSGCPEYKKTAAGRGDVREIMFPFG